MKQLTLKGSPSERGLAHGVQLKREIHQALAYYQSRFLSDADQLREHVQTLMQKVEAFRPEYIEEMDAIAQGAELDPFWIYCLNARSELMSSPKECSTLAFPEQAIMGQNWDWAQALTGLLAVADVQLENGHRFLSMIEPGMLGKLGMNSAGLGVCLNILPANSKLTGLPVHILLRALLEYRSLSEAEAIIRQHGGGQASHILVGSADHGCLGVELSDQPHFLPVNDIYLHTNHYLVKGQARSPETGPCSETRYSRMQNLLEKNNEKSVRNMMQILDNTEEPHAILRKDDFSSLIGSCSTLVSLVMNLKQKTLWLREGAKPNKAFRFYGELTKNVLSDQL